MKTICSVCGKEIKDAFINGDEPICAKCLLKLWKEERDERKRYQKAYYREKQKRNGG